MIQDWLRELWIIIQQSQVIQLETSPFDSVDDFEIDRVNSQLLIQQSYLFPFRGSLWLGWFRNWYDIHRYSVCKYAFRIYVGIQFDVSWKMVESCIGYADALIQSRTECQDGVFLGVG